MPTLPGPFGTTPPTNLSPIPQLPETTPHRAVLRQINKAAQEARVSKDSLGLGTITARLRDSRGTEAGTEAGTEDRRRDSGAEDRNTVLDRDQATDLPKGEICPILAQGRTRLLKRGAQVRTAAAVLPATANGPSAKSRHEPVSRSLLILNLTCSDDSVR